MAERLKLAVDDLKQVLRRYLDRLRRHRDDLNRLNVYPVPDGDTGTNMALTVESVVAETDAAESMAELAVAMAQGSLMGAQGNSGIILSQILRGLADAFRDERALGTAHLVTALDQASDAAYRAVGRPVEGTILTVLREAAEAARESDTAEGESLADFLGRVYARACETLERTPELLPVLKEAGVVDAGGAGFLLLLAAFLEEVTGEEVTLPEAIFRSAAVQLIEASGADDPEHMVGDLRYEVMFLLHSSDPDAGDRLRDGWKPVGDSIVVVGGEGTWNCHIHTDDIGPAIEAGVALGRPERIQVTDLLEQAALRRHHGAGGFEPIPEFAAAEVGVVAVGVGEGVMSLFRDAGAQGMVMGGQTMNPSVRDLLDVVEEVAARAVIVLPNNKNVVSAAHQLDALTTKEVLVVPTVSVPQGLAAMLAYLPGEDPHLTAAAMEQAAEMVATGEVTQAVRDARTPAGEILEGDWLGVAGGVVDVIAGSAVEAALGVLDGIVGEGAELVTIVAGEAAAESDLADVGAWLAEHRPAAEVEVVAGGQPLYPFMFGVE